MSKGIYLWVARLAYPLFVCTLLVSEAQAGSITIDFENLADSTEIGTNYSPDGINFSGAAIATAGFSLNEAEFPPYSGVNVGVDVGGPITVSFANPAKFFSGYFTYAHSLALTAYDLSNQVLGTASSLFETNFVSSGNTPNELIQLSSTVGIDHLTITGEPNGSSFTFDNVTFDANPSTSTQIPEPGTLFLEAIGIVCMGLFRRLDNST